MLDTHVGQPDHMDVDVDDSLDHTLPVKHQQRAILNHHTSDSGIGSSITGTEESLSGDHAGMRRHLYPTSSSTQAHIDAAHKLNTYTHTHNISSTVNDIRSGINGCVSSTACAQAGTQHALSQYACARIEKHIIVPILKEPTLKSFHPLVKSVPHRVGQKQIACLRDLEKVLFWLAPVSGSYNVWERSLAHGFGSGVKQFSVSRSSFLKFCETSIQCLHTTVEYLNEPDQRRPTDRPYTNGYFLDLTEQVRQYAAMITASRERAAAGKAEVENEYSTYVGVTINCEILILIVISEERLSLYGGLGQTGRPAELVRTKDGQMISLRTGDVINPDASPGSGSDGTEDDLLHSMARRKKSDQASVKQLQRCSECDKEFKRPCDLTKHEKTHSRPWKCNEPSCKYSSYGWPTEKERDRHVNDKHSVTPSMYKCQFHPCPYESKRESNCKQHMEKAHGWAYVRSKNNGKTGKKQSKAGKTPPTPQITTPGSYIFDASGSEFGEPSSPYMRNGYSVAPSVNGSIDPSEGSGRHSAMESPFLGMNDTFAPFDPNFAWADSHNQLTPQTSYNTPSSHHLSLDSGSAPNAPTLPASYEEMDPPLFGGSFDWSNMNHDLHDFTSMNIQLVTPASSIGDRSLDAYSRNPSISLEQPKNPNLSPGAQGNEMLYSPYSQNDVTDEGYDDFTTNAGKPSTDFALFDTSRPTSSLGTSGTMDMFQPLSSYPATSWSGRGTELAQHLGMNDLMPMDEER
ncbi:copper-binding transcription factor [Mycoblastus sanguinarius]|nr:copper-binding transcription factor [Mycoblastus sanguinarius]